MNNKKNVNTENNVTELETLKARIAELEKAAEFANNERLEAAKIINRMCNGGEQSPKNYISNKIHKQINCLSHVSDETVKNIQEYRRIQSAIVDRRVEYREECKPLREQNKTLEAEKLNEATTTERINEINSIITDNLKKLETLKAQCDNIIAMYNIEIFGEKIEGTNKIDVTNALIGKFLPDFGDLYTTYVNFVCNGNKADYVKAIRDTLIKWGCRPSEGKTAEVAIFIKDRIGMKRQPKKGEDSIYFMRAFKEKDFYDLYLSLVSDMLQIVGK